MLSYEVKSVSSSYAFLNGRCSRSESNASETTDLQSNVSDPEKQEISADSISLQISNLLDGFQVKVMTYMPSVSLILAR
jgi:hypothetical protein